MLLYRFSRRLSAFMLQVVLAPEKLQKLQDIHDGFVLGRCSNSVNSDMNPALWLRESRRTSPSSVFSVSAACISAYHTTQELTEKGLLLLQGSAVHD